VGHGGGKIRRKNAYAMVIALCSVFIFLPFAGAVENVNTTTTNTPENNLNTTSDQNLKQGMTGLKVEELQIWLKERGYYSGAIDGAFGPWTEEAVKSFQRQADITVDGIVGPLTNQTMYQWDISRSNAQKESSINAVSSTSSGEKHTTASKYRTSNAMTTTSTTRSSKYGGAYTSGKGVGDCWANSEYLYGQLSASGQTARIVQYRNSYVNNHRSVQIYQNGAWVDYNYKANGYSWGYYAQANKPGMTVIK